MEQGVIQCGYSDGLMLISIRFKVEARRTF
jgi:hypothetical protein